MDTSHFPSFPSVEQLKMKPEHTPKLPSLKQDLPSLKQELYAAGYADYKEQLSFSVDELNHLTDLFAAPLSNDSFDPLLTSEYPSLLPDLSSVVPQSPAFENSTAVQPIRTVGEKKKIMNVQQLTMSTPARRRNKRSTVQCVMPYCLNRSRSRGLCKKHGGGKRCSEEGCDRPAQCKGKCPKHGGATRCKIDGCEKFSQSQGLCKGHGGGTLCAFDGCAKNAHQNRFCRTHGGGLKCNFSGCTKWAQKSGFCCGHTAQSSQNEKEDESVL